MSKDEQLRQQRPASIVVIGGGAMGTSAACELARRGHPVTVLEQHEAGHARGSSHGSSRIMRMVYDDPFFVRLALSARPLWDDLQRLADVEVFHQCGSLDHGPRSHLEPFAAALKACDVPFEWLTPEDAEQRWPGLRVDEAAIFQPDGGVTHADNTLLTLRRLAEEAGATWHEHTRADSVVETTEGVTVTAGPRIFTADQVVVATGVWAHALTDLPEELATQVQPAHFTPIDGRDVWPTFIHRRTDDDGAPAMEAFGLPSPDGVKVGFHGGGKIVDPDHRDFAVVEAEVEQLRAYVDRWAPGLDATTLETTTCLYGTLAEDDFTVDRTGRVTIAAGFSGHGFKFVPLIGPMVADLVSGEAEPLPRFTLAAHRSSPAGHNPGGRDPGRHDI